MYAESARLLRERLPRFGIKTTFVDALDAGAYARAIAPATRVLYIETPANPVLGDRPTSSRSPRSRRGAGLITVADNTFATPFAQTPLAPRRRPRRALDDEGARRARRRHRRRRLRSRARVVARPRPRRKGLRRGHLPVHGVPRLPRPAHVRSPPAPAVRVRRVLAARLAEHPRIATVHHPSLAEPPRARARARQMHAYGSLLSFELAADGEPATHGARRGPARARRGARRSPTPSASATSGRSSRTPPPPLTRRCRPRTAPAPRASPTGCSA